MDKPITALKHLANGESIDQTADLMNLSRSSVEKHLATIKKRLNARNLTNTVYIAAKSGLIVVVLIVSSSSHDDVSFERRRVSQRRREQYEFLLQSTTAAA